MRRLAESLRGLESPRIVLRRLEQRDAPALEEMVRDAAVYRYLPVFLYERRYPDTRTVIDGLYGECLDESLILGIFENGRFCGLAEWYDLRPEPRSVSIGNRLLSRCWGKGLASETLQLMLRGLEEQTDIRCVTATTMTDNLASARVLRNNGFVKTAENAAEDWGFETPMTVDVWMKSIGNGRIDNT